jgi:predicted ATPase/DNA-binding SARP family transcriptional activator
VIEVRALGTLEVLDAEGSPVGIGGPRPTTIMLALVLAGGSVVSADGLVEEVWGDQAPRSAVETLHSYLSRIRRALEPDRSAHGTATALVRSQAGYRIDPAVVAVDVHDFESEVARARVAASGGDIRSAAELLRVALGRWRGPVGQGMELGAGSRAQATRLEELRLTATEERSALLLGLGDHEELIGDLEPMVVANPLRERLHALWMVALYRSGRQAEALAAYRRLREQLVDGLGVEPGPRLLQLHERMLAQDPSLEPDERLGSDIVRPDPGTVRPTAPPGTARSEASVPSTAPPGNLPAPMVELVGRRDQLDRLAAELESSRLVTLTGAGGCGKTQLALQLARETVARFPDGTWLVELASRRDPDAVPRAVAEALAVDDAPLPGLVDQLAGRLHGRRALLLLDNCEHLVDACASMVQELLQRCPELQVLTTSRQTLDLDGEVAWRVPSLSLPPAGANLANLAASDAARLFLTRAAGVRSDFEPDEDDASAIAAICRELDGIPLAIELAASRLRVLSPQEIADRLDDRFAMLRSSRRGAPPRHRTLDAAISWSYELLEPSAQVLLLRLAVFEGGFTVAAAEATCSSDELAEADILELLDDLVGRSLVGTSPASVGPARHELLQSIRSFARARWSDDARDAISARHAGWCATLGDVATTELTGPDQVRWLNELHADHADLRAALAWALEHDRVDLALRITAGVWWFWLQFGHAREGAAWLAAVLAAADAASASLGDLDAGLLVRATYAAGRLAGAAGEHPPAKAWLEQAAELAERQGSTGWWALSLARLGQQLQVGGDPDAAADALRAAREVAEGHDDPWVAAGISDVAGHLAAARGDLEAATAAFAISEQRYLQAQDRWSACLARLGRAWVARRSGDLGHALALHGENLRSTRTLTRSAFDFVGIARDLRGVAAVASQVGRHGLAAQLCGASETLRTLGEVALTSHERVEVEALIRAATEAIGPTAVATEQAVGRSFGAADALTTALRATDELQDATALLDLAPADAGP